MIILKGAILDARSGKPVAGMKISAWEKDLQASDQIGFAISDQRGRFAIPFNPKQFMDETRDQPAVFFLLYQGNEVIHSTEEKPFTQWKESDNIIIQINRKEADNTPDYIAQGKVIDSITKQPVPGLKVEAWDRDDKKSDFLGARGTDFNGVFTITYDATRFTSPDIADTPDIFFRVFTGETCIHSTEDKPLKNSGKLYDIVIELKSNPDDIAPLRPAPAFDRKEIGTISELAGLSLVELQKKNPELFQKLQKKAEQQLHKDLVNYFSENSLEAKVFIRQLKLEQTGLAQNQTPQEAITELAQKSRLSPLVKLEIAEHMQNWSGVSGLDAVFNPQLPLGQNALFVKELRKADLVKAATMSGLAEAPVQQLINRDLDTDQLSHELLDSLVKEKILTGKDAAALGLHVNIIQLSAGNTRLPEVIKNSLNGKALRNLAAWRRSDWENLLTKNQIEIPKETTVKEYAAFLRKQVEMIYPDQSFISLHRTLEKGPLSKQLQQLTPLIGGNDQLFNAIPFDELQLTDIPPAEQEKLRKPYEDLNKTINRYPGLHISTVLAQKDVPGTEKINEVQRRINLLENFYSQNQDVPLLSLDYTPDSEDLQQLSFKNISEKDQELVLANLRSGQRMYHVTMDTEDARNLMENGYHAAYQVSSDSYAKFKNKTGMEEAVARRYYDAAAEITKGLTANAGTILDVIYGGLDWLGPIYRGPQVKPWLNRLDGFASLFGNQNYCQCDDCKSIISPAAYFVDLMDFLQKNVLDEHFTGAKANHILNPKVRRRDLWNGLPLTCENTNKLIPYLVIILEILENYLASRPGSGYSGSMNNRPAIEAFVYKKLYDLPSINSFYQPFLMPMEALDIYLNHFPVKRENIARLVLQYGDDPTHIIPQSQLRLSLKEYELITTPNATVAFLSDLYGMPFPASGIINPRDVQPFLRRMECSRKEFTQLVNTRFVSLDGAESADIVASTSAGSVQPDKEQVHGLTLAFLDRLHRFLRLKRNLEWSIDELDQVLFYLREAGIITDAQSLPVHLLSQWSALQKQLKLKIPELVSLFTLIPANWKSSFFSQLFNLPAFIRQGEWDPATLSLSFQHPAYRSDLPDNAGTAILHRLLAGLGMNDDDLYLLIENLKTSLGSAADGSFTLTHASLSLLYRHARLARALKISITQLFALMKIQSTTVINSPEKLFEIAELVNWWKETKFKVEDLLFLTGLPVPETYVIPDGKEAAEGIMDQVIVEQHLIFAATLFSYFPGITETQSAEIIAANTDLIERANIRSYRVSPTVTDPSTVAIIIPPAIATALSPSGITLLENHIREMLSIYLQPGAADIPDHVFVGVAGLNRAQSQSILDTNAAIYLPTASAELYWLSPAYTPGSVIVIPAGIPLSADDAKQHLLAYYAGEIIPVMLARQFGITSEKSRALALLAGFDFTSPATSDALAQLLHGTADSPVLVQLMQALQKLSTWFKDEAFTVEALTFMQQQSGGGTALFHITNYSAPTLNNIKQTFLFLQLLKKAKDKTAALFTVLTSFDFTTAMRFADDSLDGLSQFLKAEQGIVTSLNQVLPFPVSDPVTLAPANRALEALNKLAQCVSMVQFLGIGGEALPLMLATDYDGLSAAVESIVAAIRTKYETEEEYLEKIEPFEDKIREQKRDALTDYFIHVLNPVMFKYPNDLYHYFLIDTELMGCARTSRVVAGLSSLQLYIQRCIMNLEQSEDGNLHVQPTDIPVHEWEWRKNFRVWQANRKVFLWPENYIEPDLRDDKTSLFKDIESELLTQDINAQTVQDAYAKYMKGFSEIGNLKIAGSYHDKSSSRDVLHLFGCTNSDPGEYYYRTVENIYQSQEPDTNKGIVWGNWEKINVQIPVRKVSPIIFRNKLYVFWTEIFTKARNETLAGSQVFAGYEHTMIVKFTSLNLDGSWTPPQTLQLDHSVFSKGPGLIWDPLVSATERSGFMSELVSSTLFGLVIPPGLDADAAWLIFTDHFIKGLKKAAKEGEGVLESTSYAVEYGSTDAKILIDMTQPAVRRLFRPRYEFNSNDIQFMHVEPRDGYTLKEEKWTRVFPSQRSANTLALNGRSFDMLGKVDLFARKVSQTNYSPSFSVPRTPAYRRLTFANNGIEFGYFVMHTSGRQYTEATWARDMYPIVLDRGKLLTYSPTNNMDLEIVNGVLTDGILNYQGDLLYIHANRTTRILGMDFWPYALKRIGTMLSEKLERRLFEAGIDGLLDIYYQEWSVKEPSLPVTVNGFALLPDVEKNVGKMDTTGSMGVYFREIFFHIPYLIANHLNSQGKYADAMRWYHYIFNPTSDKLPFDYYTEPDPVKKKKRELDRVWQFIEFRNHTVQTLKEQLNDKAAIYAYENDPFNPHAIARLRLGGYMKNIVMKYIDNLLDWGDSLFAQDTLESINEATLLYIMAAELLGRRPAELGECKEERDAAMTFEAIYHKMKYGRRDDDYVAGVESIGAGRYRATKAPEENRYLVPGLLASRTKAAMHITTGTYFSQRYAAESTTALANDEPDFRDSANTNINVRAANAAGIASDDSMTWTGNAAAKKSNSFSALNKDVYFMGPQWKLFDMYKYFPLASFGTTFLQQSRVFCIPRNKDLLAYWDRVDDRLYKIRRCMNFSGLKRQLALFAPEIDPRLLVRARAEGLSMEDILSNLNGNLPPYRFNYLIMKAKEYTGMLQSFGAALLTAMEKKDAEELNRMRIVQQENIMKLSTKMRDQEIEAAELGIEALERRKETILQRKGHYNLLLDEGLTGWEQAQQVTKHIGNFLMPAVITLTAVSGGLEMIPKILGMASSTGGEESSKSVEKFGTVMRFLADSFAKASDSMALEANFQRREQGWQFQLDQTNSELSEIEKQIDGARVRLEISKKSKELHDLSIQQLEETYDYYQNKFSNFGLYTWLSTYLQRLHRAAYQDALAMARMAERAYRFEKNDDTTPLLDSNYWDATHVGLLAGERLQSDLRSMERKYMETHYRTMEIDQAFSLAQIDPAALLQLKSTGECEFTIPELYFDLFYPGQYRRRIKSARVTIPSVTGPFTNVSATLSLKESFIRKDAITGDEQLLTVPPMRSVTIATSTGQNDSGVFRLDFRDERYMPFEGAGAVNSTWGLLLPKSFRPFDYNTINDIILHISYTAEYDGAFRETVEGDNGAILGEIHNTLSNNSLPRLFSIRQEFSTAFHRLFHQQTGTVIPFELSEKHFPLFLQGRELTITGAKLVLVIDEDKLEDSSGSLPPIDLDLTITGNGGGSANITSFMLNPDLQQPTATIPSSIFAAFQPGTAPVNLTITVNNAGVFEPDELAPGLPVLNNIALKDIALMVEYRLA